ncbi:NAD(P)-dependent dehydrogenase, short-chain alcohol dehydrogenase family [Lysobacter sp. yr284]|uniref:SDR family NAD(P)-dependent oxidoreductase n=1 Tax=Lysobacter sp. yr284 TaxID=1761791 RepID=UPI000898FCAF|nr:SDR family NAD(P)-dependent oxidoreductase [Lysobacter sp. yr284]SDZ20571.1 NAD(P)-dependent dehydrogenase, short-chain alcohol dehydrogenase family [Lysobacter sp. yr284]
MRRDKHLVWNYPDAQALDVEGKRVAIIGGTGGIGRALSRHLALLGADVVVVGQTFRDAGVPGIAFIQADLSLMREAKRVAAELPTETLDMVIFTTGIFAAPERQETAEGIERDLAVSFLNRLVILHAIAPKLGTKRPSSSGKPRVFLMGYPGAGQVGKPDDLNAEKSYKVMPAHMNTVAGNEMLVLDAAKRYPNATFFGLNPGPIKTNIRDNLLGKNTLKSRVVEALIGLMMPSANVYAMRIAPLLLTPDIEGHSGAMFNNKGQAILPSRGLTDEHIRRFMAASQALVIRTGISDSAS